VHAENGKHDDQADSTAQFLDWFKMPFPGPWNGWLGKGDQEFESGFLQRGVTELNAWTD
jgi:hypothetical protein